MYVFPRRLLIVAAVAVGFAAGCSKGPEARRGSPVLLQAFWQTLGGRALIWSRDADAAIAPAVPAAGTEIDFVFDRRLDGERVEDSDGGVPVSKPTPPVTVGWADAATVMSDPPFAVSVFYNSLGAFGAETSYVLVQPRLAGFPSGTTINFMLDPAGLTSPYGEPMDGPTEISVATEPLSIVSLPTGARTAPTGFLAPVSFSTRVDVVDRAALLAPFVHVAAAGTPLGFTLVADPGDRMLLYVAPATCNGKWPAGVLVEMTFDAGLPDAFGQPLPTAVTGNFVTSTTGGATDAGCD
jgi:hypothetical protein